ncbi:MAG: TetR/AcrR family transcriptional regulator [Lachnospiraceae bacterium]|nr:TetR/AcrR family transcriptional regulator [Lachnospiraceae bacterium]
MKKQPEITEKTRQRFVDAFWELAQEKPIRKIAVNELTRRAGYNRSTFYEYFLDTDDLLAYVEDQLLEDLKQEALLSLPENGPQKDLESTNLFSNVFLLMNEKMYLLAGPTGDPGFITRVKEELIPIVAPHLPISTDTDHFDYVLSFVSSAALGLLQYWHNQNKSLSAEEVCVILQTLMLRGLSAYVTPKEPLGNGAVG